MVKSISESSRGRYNLKKKKVWIKLEESDEDVEVEYETEIIDLDYKNFSPNDIVCFSSDTFWSKHKIAHGMNINYLALEDLERDKYQVLSITSYLIDLNKNTKEISLTFEDASKIKNSKLFDTIFRVTQEKGASNLNYFPNNKNFNWNNDHLGPIYIPKKGDRVDLDINNLPIYKKIIKDYEFNDIKILNGKIIINNEEQNTYTFKQDYYWMMGDNRYNSEDSRVWGFVPFDHVLGKPVFIWMSIDGLFSGIQNWRFRWDRIFTTIGLDGKPRSYLPHFIAFIVLWQIYVFFKRRKSKS